MVDRDSVVGIATRYGQFGLWIESRWGQDYPHPSRLQDWPWGPLTFLYDRYHVFPGGKVAGEWH
jgi:hypothetical protein